MFRGLLANTVVSATAFLATAGIPLLLIPLIVGHYGIVEYGLVVLARILLPTGTLAIFDFGNSEIATQTVVRARHDGDWAHAGRRLSGLALITLAAGLVVSSGLAIAARSLGEFFDVPNPARPGFEQIIVATSAAFTLLLLALIAEGVLKGFEAFRSLRLTEVSCTLAYGIAAAVVVFTGAAYQWIVFVLLASLLVRAAVVFLIARRLMRGKGFRLDRPQGDDWRDLGHRCRLMASNRTLSAAQSQAAPLFIGVLLGAGAVGVYDLIIRFPRFLKVLVGLMSTAVLPVSSRLDVTKDEVGMRRLGELGMLGAVAVAAPICAWGAAFSEPLLLVWLNDIYAAYWPWQSLMFVVPLLNAMTSFGGGALLGRVHVVAQMNVIALMLIIVQFTLGLGLASVFGERAFVLGQVVAVLVSFPFQMRLVAMEKQLSIGAFRRHVAIVGTLVALIALCYVAGAADWVSSLFGLALSLATWMAASYLAMWFFILRPEERDAILSLLRARKSVSQSRAIS